MGLLRPLPGRRVPKLAETWIHARHFKLELSKGGDSGRPPPGLSAAAPRRMGSRAAPSGVPPPHVAVLRGARQRGGKNRHPGGREPIPVPVPRFRAGGCRPRIPPRGKIPRPRTGSRAAPPYPSPRTGGRRGGLGRKSLSRREHPFLRTDGRRADKLDQSGVDASAPVGRFRTKPALARMGFVPRTGGRRFQLWGAAHESSPFPPPRGRRALGTAPAIPMRPRPYAAPPVSAPVRPILLTARTAPVSRREPYRPKPDRGSWPQRGGSAAVRPTRPAQPAIMSMAEARCGTIGALAPRGGRLGVKDRAVSAAAGSGGRGPARPPWGRAAGWQPALPGGLAVLSQNLPMATSRR